jgi:hypothetical protein
MEKTFLNGLEEQIFYNVKATSSTSLLTRSSSDAAYMKTTVQME